MPIYGFNISYKSRSILVQGGVVRNQQKTTYLKIGICIAVTLLAVCYLNCDGNFQAIRDIKMAGIDQNNQASNDSSTNVPDNSSSSGENKDPVVVPQPMPVPVVLPKLNIEKTLVITEGSTFAVKISIDKAFDKEVKVTYKMSDLTAMAGKNYLAQSGQVVFVPGKVEQTIPVTTYAISGKQANTKFNVNLENPTNAEIQNSVSEIQLQDAEETGDVTGLSKDVKLVVAAGWNTCAVTTANRVFCVGGLQTAGVNSATPVEIQDLYTGGEIVELAGGTAMNIVRYASGDIKTFMGSKATDHPSLKGKVVKIASGVYSACVLLLSGEVQCNSALGFTPKTNISEAIDLVGTNYHFCVLNKSGKIKCWKPREGSPDYNYEVEQSVDIKSKIAISGNDGCVNQSDKGVKCWIGTSLTAMAVVTDIVELSTTATSTGTFCGITTSGGLSCWNRQAVTPYPTFDPSRLLVSLNIQMFPVGVKQVSVGYQHICLIVNGGALKCFGQNDNGQLGLGR